MAWKDLPARLSRWLGGGNGAGETRRPDGGTSCYRPVQRRDRQQEELARQKAAEYAQEQPQVAYAHTGFTGMNPPMTGMAPVQSTMTGTAYGYEAPMAQPQGQTAYAPQPSQQENGSRQPNNISYMPGAYAPDAGSSFTHVEHILTITSLRSCYEAIECMKNGETLIVTLDVLGSEAERIRCQDMLAGAAFTLGCSVRSLPSVGVVIIAPGSVKLLPEQASHGYAEPLPEQRPAVQSEEAYMGRRERRSSQNPVGWKNATSGLSAAYNPYTGTMPAAAGAYSAYGGY